MDFSRNLSHQSFVILLNRIPIQPWLLNGPPFRPHVKQGLYNSDPEKRPGHRQKRRLPDNKASDYNKPNCPDFRHVLIIKIAIRSYL